MPTTKLPKTELVLASCRGKHDGIPCPLQWVDPRNLGKSCFYCRKPTQQVWKAVRSANGDFQVLIMAGDD